MSTFFIIYSVFVILFWIYMLALGTRRKMRWPVVFAWMVSGANIIGFILYLFLRERFMETAPAEGITHV